MKRLLKLSSFMAENCSFSVTLKIKIEKECFNYFFNIYFSLDFYLSASFCIPKGSQHKNPDIVILLQCIQPPKYILKY